MGFPEAKWAVDQVVSKIGVQPNNMRKFVVLSLSANTVGLQFLEPADSYYSTGGALAAVTKGVMIRMSDEDYPQGLNDGTLVLDNQNLGDYENNSFVVSGLTEGQEYFFSAFPYSNIGVYNESLNAANKASGIPISGETVTVNVTIDDESEFTGTTVTLRNITLGTDDVRNVSTSGQVNFVAKAGNVFKVVVGEVDNYKQNMTESEQFTAVPGGSRSYTFTYELIVGFNYTITFDNGGDGIPASFTYSDDAAGFTPAQVSNMGSWANTELLDYFKPCLIKPSATEPEYFLNKNNYNLKEDGSASVLTGNDGDVMVQIKRLFYKVTKLTATKEIKLSIASYQVDSTYKSFNVVAGEDREFVYRGVYEAYTMSNQMRSVSGVVPTVSQTRAQFRTTAKARGNEYSQNDYYMLFLYQCMYIMLYGNRNSQVALGQGRTLSSNTAGVSTGTLNDKPFCWGDQGGVNGVKFLGVEHFFGDRWEMVDGLTLVNQVYKVTRDPAKYDDVGTSYETSINSAPTTDAYITSMKGVEDGIFLPDTVTGSEATYFCDYFYQGTTTHIALFGGYWCHAAQAGAFCLTLSNAPSHSGTTFGSRLCRK